MECRGLGCENLVVAWSSGDGGWDFVQGVQVTLPTLVVGDGIGIILRR